MINVFFFKVVKFVLEVIKFLVRKMDEEFQCDFIVFKVLFENGVSLYFMFKLVYIVRKLYFILIYIFNQYIFIIKKEISYFVLFIFLISYIYLLLYSECFYYLKMVYIGKFVWYIFYIYIIVFRYFKVYLSYMSIV